MEDLHVELVMAYRTHMLMVSIVLLVATQAADAHFTLLEPASWLVEDTRGDPQKAAPCGGTSADAGTPSGAITKLQGGRPLRLKVQETVFHPGHYRVALARTRAALPPDPEVTTRASDRGPQSVSAVIQNPPQAPVLADGLFAHTARPVGPWEADILIPNIDCERCTIQIIQFMAEHAYNNPGGYSYHQCADFEITADPAKPLATGWPAAQ